MAFNATQLKAMENCILNQIPEYIRRAGIDKSKLGDLLSELQKIVKEPGNVIYENFDDGVDLTRQGRTLWVRALACFQHEQCIISWKEQKLKEKREAALKQKQKKVIDKVGEIWLKHLNQERGDKKPPRSIYERCLCATRPGKIRYWLKPICEDNDQLQTLLGLLEEIEKHPENMTREDDPDGKGSRAALTERGLGIWREILKTHKTIIESVDIYSITNIKF
jgi:hypothetical protein